MSTRTMPYTYQAAATLTLVPQTCCSCGVLFGMESGFDKQRRNDRKSWFCPNGHSQHYSGKTEAERLQEQLDASRSLAKRERERREAAERSTRAYKGQVTKVKRRLNNGVCPVPSCRRHFADLERHIGNKHPDWTADGPGGHQ